MIESHLKFGKNPPLDKSIFRVIFCGAGALLPDDHDATHNTYLVFFTDAPLGYIGLIFRLALHVKKNGDFAGQLFLRPGDIVDFVNSQTKLAEKNYVKDDRNGHLTWMVYTQPQVLLTLAPNQMKTATYNDVQPSVVENFNNKKLTNATLSKLNGTVPSKQKKGATAHSPQPRNTEKLINKLNQRKNSKKSEDHCIGPNGKEETSVEYNIDMIAAFVEGDEKNKGKKNKKKKSNKNKDQEETEVVLDPSTDCKKIENLESDLTKKEKVKEISTIVISEVDEKHFEETAQAGDVDQKQAGTMDSALVTESTKETLETCSEHEAVVQPEIVVETFRTSLPSNSGSKDSALDLCARDLNSKLLEDETDEVQSNELVEGNSTLKLKTENSKKQPDFDDDINGKSTAPKLRGIDSLFEKLELQLTQERTKHEARVKKLEQKLEKQESVKELKKKNKKLESTVVELETEIETLKKEVGKLKLCFDEGDVESLKDKLYAARKSLIVQTGQLNKQLNELETKNAELTRELNKSRVDQKEIHRLKSALGRTKDKADSSEKQKLEQELKELRSNKKELSKQLEQAQLIVEQHKLNQETFEKYSNPFQLEEQLKQSKRELEQSKREQEELQGSLNRLAHLDEEMMEMRAKKKTLDLHMGKLLVEQKEMKNQLAESKDHIGRLSNELSESRDHVALLSKEVKSLESFIGKLKKTISILQNCSRCTKLDVDIKNLEDKVTLLESLKDKLIFREKSQTAEKSQFENRVKALTVENSDLRKTIELEKLKFERKFGLWEEIRSKLESSYRELSIKQKREEEWAKVVKNSALSELTSNHVFMVQRETKKEILWSLEYIKSWAIFNSRVRLSAPIVEILISHLKEVEEYWKKVKSIQATCQEKHNSTAQGLEILDWEQNPFDACYLTHLKRPKFPICLIDQIMLAFVSLMEGLVKRQNSKKNQVDSWNKSISPIQTEEPKTEEPKSTPRIQPEVPETISRVQTEMITMEECLEQLLQLKKSQPSGILAEMTESEIIKHIKKRWFAKSQDTGQENRNIESRKSSEGSDENMCSICMESLGKGKTSTLTGCNHEFHIECIREWMKRDRVCPNCRKHSVLPEDYPALK